MAGRISTALSFTLGVKVKCISGRGLWEEIMKRFFAAALSRAVTLGLPARMRGVKLWQEATMRPDDLLTWLRAQPFRPFRIHLNSGQSYTIRHPEMIRVTRSTAYVFFPDDADQPFDRAEMVSLLLMERVEPVVEAHGAAK